MYKRQVGDWVLYFNPRKYRGRQNKWIRNYEGPFLVIGVPTSLTVKIQRSVRANPKVVHVDKLKVFEGNPPKKWTLVAQEATDVGSPPALSRGDPSAVANGDAAENGNEEVESLPDPIGEDSQVGRSVTVEVEVHRSDEADGASEHPTSKPTKNKLQLRSW